MKIIHKLFAFFFILPCVLRSDTLPLPQSGDMLQVTLEGLLFQNPNTPGRTLMMEFNRLDGHWFMGGGHSPSYNRGTHRGVISFTEEGSLDSFRMQVDVQGDAWVSGGFVDVKISWSTEDGETFTGTYEGKSLGRKVSGVARGEYFSRLESLPGFEAAARGQHPRLLLTDADLPALREKAETDFGKEALARFEESAVGLGLLYLLREDPAYAERAKEAVQVHMADMESGNKSIRHRFWGYRLEQIAITYDLCYHAWPEEFRVEVQDYIRALARRMHRERGSWTEYVQWHPENAYNASMIYSGVIGMLAIADVEGDAPNPPSAPEVERLAPKDWTLEIDVPQVDVEPGVIPAKFWYSGPLSQEQFQAFREAGGDLATLELDEEKVRMIERDPEVRGIVRSGYTGNHDALCVNQASGTAFDSWNIFATRWQVKEAGNYYYQSNHNGVVPYLNGERIGNSVLLNLEPGEYTLVLAAPLGRPNPWAGVFVRPVLRPVSDGEVEKLQAEKNESYAQSLIFQRQVKVDWEKLGGVDPATTALVRDALFWFRRYEETKFGAAGSQVGSTNSMALEGPGLMATIYRNVTGQPLGHRNGIAYWLPRKLMVFSWTAEGGEVHQDFFGDAGFHTKGFQDERPNRGLILSALFPTIAPEFQPMAWWFWQEAGNPFKAHALPQANRLVSAGHPGTSYNSIPVYAFLHAPLDMEPRHPSEVLPKSWHDSVTGDFIFRNAWENEQDVVLQMTAQQTYNRGGSQTSGSFALRGLGHNWTADHVVSMTSMPPRNEHPVVQTENPNQFREGRGRVLEAQSYADGSGVVRMDLSKSYRSQSEQVEHRRDVRDNTGAIYPGVLVDDGGNLSAIRTILTDYSGAAGVPAVVILLDQLEGVENHFWSWPLSIDIQMRGNSPGTTTPIERVEIEKPEHVHLFDNGFHLRHGDKQLTTRFISDEKLDVGLIGLQNLRHIVHSRCQLRTRNLLIAEGTDTYLAVITLGEGDPPEIETERSGDSLQIKIGDAMYRLEKGHLRFEGKNDAVPFPPLQ
ncbi:MAG: hypothetical protein JJU29_07945 [Verrucomicrobia bacterium]|nr:hypothetical protein [Verrucomicrobiota bacterium]MCH8511943.1 hypothetical protein [Kiritimatiellia bacterium]